MEVIKKIILKHFNLEIVAGNTVLKVYHAQQEYLYLLRKHNCCEFPILLFLLFSYFYIFFPIMYRILYT